MAWKVYADGVLVPNTSRIDFGDKAKVIVYARADTLATPMNVDHLVAVWERQPAKRVPHKG